MFCWHERCESKRLSKEALQVYTLAAIYGQPASDRIIFQGGTCLRLVYGGPRYSVDVDAVRRELENFLPYRYRVQLLQQAALEAMVAEVKALLEGVAP